MQIKKNLIKIGALANILATAQSFAGPRESYFHPQHNWLPAVSICTVPEMLGKNDYDGYLRIVEDYSNKKKDSVQCKNLNNKDWHKIEIKRRGNSSNRFAKKQYRVKILDEKGEKKEFPLGGLPESSKWVLNAPYVDRSHIRNIFTFKLGEKMGATRGDLYFAPKTKSYELFMNGKYYGVYVLIEKIERGKNKVPVKKLNKQDKNLLSFIAEISSNDGEFKTDEGTYIRYRYPSNDKLKEIHEENPHESLRIKNQMNEAINAFEKIIADEDKLDKLLQDSAQKLINIDSFIDFILIEELTKNVDGFRRSAYFYRDSKGTFHMGPLWDFNLALGNLSFYGMSKPEGWLFKKKYGVMKNAFWFKNLINNKIFNKKLKERYLNFRSYRNPLATKSLIDLVDQIADPMHTASLRDYHAWSGSFSFAERNFMTTKEKGLVPQDHINILKLWIKKRLKWMDSNISKI